MRHATIIRGAAALLLVALTSSAWAADEYEREPIEYSKSTPKNRVSQLAEALESGEKTLEREPKVGYLRSLLEALEVPESSQTLVFSKTSLQRSRISPKTPRAIYFSDDTYVGFCQNGDVVEITAVDDELGAVFYTLDQRNTETARITRETNKCLVCHSNSGTQNVPGHVVRSVYSDAAGLPILSSGTFRTDQTSPFSERWGGWYVTGTHGDQKHLGNLIVRKRTPPEQIDNSEGQNVTSLDHLVSTKNYLTPHSDIVALMVLEHQAAAHNHIAHANFATRQAVHYEQSLNRELGNPLDEPWDSTTSRIRSACEPLVEYLLFCDEAPLTEKVEGTSGFAEEFSAKGPHDSKGRSLRQLRMNGRMFEYPCSYLVYSPAMKALPKRAKDYVYRRLVEVLTGVDKDKKFDHLSPEDRKAIREILLETLPDFRAAHEAMTLAKAS